MRIIIELSPAEAEAREEWQNYDDDHADNIDVYDARWKRLAEAAVAAASEIAASVDLRRRDLFARDLPTLVLEGVDLAYARGPSFERGAHVGDVVAHVRYTLAGADRSPLIQPQRPPAPKPRENCKCEDGGARLGFLHIDNSEDYPTLGDHGQHIERCDYCAVFPDDESAVDAHAAHCDCGWGDRLLPICPRCGDALAERDDCMACACGYRVATSWWREAIAATCETCNLAMHLITKGDSSGTEVYQCPKCEHEIEVGDLARIQRGCPAGCACERCRPELYVK